MRGLEGKKVIITGAAGGVGRALAERFAEEGCTIGLLDIDGRGIVDLAGALEGRGGRVTTHEVDITDASAVDAAVGTFAEAHGGIDVLVNNAGWDRFALFLETTPEFWRKVVDINLLGPIHMHHAVLRRMKDQGRGGRVVNIASDAGRVGSSGEAVYSACKGGIIAFTKTMAREMARAGVLVNCVSPGPIDTPLFHSFVEAGETGRKVHDSLGKAIPLRRIANPSDLPGIVAFLASDDAAYITGQVVSVSGGLTMHG